ncbi:sensor histidine kinase [Hyalangium rubrum]|uniref:histidine kinase n=1 Tax=Hyalangium rubrum TaxID=3103134 RepID=A0ABU5H5R9_9BACT|nr:ATP-binding protein [Hyalangium sp. s54d21]MDY7228829.1 ATP-binding protein [Hyalangium sp. s54d21]
MTPVLEVDPVGPSAPSPLEPRGSSRGLRIWFLEHLDLLLSERQRGAVASELIRYRVLAGSAAFLLLFDLLVLVLLPGPLTRFVLVLLALGYLGTLLLVRRASSPTGPAMLLCGCVFLALVVVTLTLKGLQFMGMYSAHTLLPVLAVYLMGPRLGLLFTLVLIGTQSVFHPLYQVSQHLELTPYFWPLYAISGICIFAAWGLSSLHEASRDAAQALLERTLKILSESESRLQSLIESTDDQVCSLDREGHVLTANMAMRQAHLQRTGSELMLGQSLFSPMPPRLKELWEAHFAPVLVGQRSRFEETEERAGVRATLDICVNPIQGEGGRVTGMTIFARDITPRKEAEARLGEMHRTLVDVSRQAGMAEVATGVLHNVGNTLNSINVSANLVLDKLHKSRVPGLARSVELLREHASELGTFLTIDPQGQKLPVYLTALSEQLHKEREELLQEMRTLGKSIEHIKSIISMQQRHARGTGAAEPTRVPQLIDEALRLHSVSLERMGIRIERDYADVPPIVVDRHKLLQILVNLLSNAQHALLESGRQDKCLGIHVRTKEGGTRFLLEVSDNGVGIAPENLARMFTQGFTTKKTGHGFGLHISALAAKEMGGQLTCASPGLQQGTTFTLELPTAAPTPPT